ncbi:MAG: Tim44/TimA family putative adaptor protein [Proteobacteria bacterium]|nr:Tim44/TimA family putative adaptor protein [Pseudomonadota bacterium]MDA0845756.1 Tim44/TimA family putative adaptor protein [Pseudomonadota bacterium]
MPLIDILIFAVIAVLLVLRLRSVLGQRTGYEEPQDNKAKESFADKPNAPVPFPKAADKNAKISGSGLDVLRRADRQFNENEFIQGATAAFNMILTAFAEGDQAQLKRLLSYELLQSFMRTIHDRTAAKETLEITVNDIREVSILNVELADSVASITVHFHTTQTRIARDEHGDVMEESDTEPREFIDIWTFERDLTLADPNWKLAETESANDDS